MSDDNFCKAGNRAPTFLERKAETDLYPEIAEGVKNFERTSRKEKCW